MKVLVIDDDTNIIQAVNLSFKIRWPEAELISTVFGKRGIELTKRKTPDIVILDLGLPDVNGFEVLKQIRLFSSVPVMMLTVSADEANIVRALEGGADDYLVKPFRPMELLARVNTLTRRQNPPEPPLGCGPLRFDPATRELIYNGKRILLTPTEADIVYHLMRNMGRAVSPSDLARKVWGDVYSGSLESIDLYVRHLQAKIEKDPWKPQLILSKANVGYCLAF